MSTVSQNGSTPLSLGIEPLLPLRPERGRSLLFVLIVMAFLAALALLFSRGADRLLERWSVQLSQNSTIQVMISDESRRDREVEAVQTILREALPRAGMQTLTREESIALIQPWMGSGALPDDLPIPAVIRIKSEIRLPTESLTRQFEVANVTTVIDDHSRFSGKLRQTVGRLVLLGLALVVLIGFAAMAVNVFATRSTLAAQRDIIHVLVQAGASDGFVAGLFVGQAAQRGAVGAGIGVVLAFTVWIIVSFGPGQESVGWHGLRDGIYDSVFLVALAFLFGAICASAAGWAAMRQLAYERRRA